MLLKFDDCIEGKGRCLKFQIPLRKPRIFFLFFLYFLCVSDMVVLSCLLLVGGKEKAMEGKDFMWVGFPLQ